MGTRVEPDWRAAAQANLLQARQRHGARLGVKKSRTGCTTCKTRRVKCDELRPECQRCRDSGRRCAYDAPPASQGGERQDLTAAIGPRPSQSLALTESERRTLDYFIACTAPCLAGAWDKVWSFELSLVANPVILKRDQEFWCKSVLQLAHRESFVLDCLLAISVLYEHPQYLASFTGRPGQSPSSEHPGTSFEGPPVLDSHHAHALRLYSRAIQRFTDQMNDGKATHLLALLSCVLFICIETIRDNVFGAMGLFTQGSEILKWVDRTKLSADEKAMLGLVEHIFQRMALQAGLYGHPSGASIREGLRESTQSEFKTLTDARNALFALAIGSFSFVQQADSYRRTLINDKLGVTTTATYVDSLDTPSDIFIYGLEMFGITKDSRSVFLDASDSTEAKIEEHGVLSALRSYFDRLGPDADSKVSGIYRDLLIHKAANVTRFDRWYEALSSLLKRLPPEERPPEVVSYLLQYYHSASIWMSTRLEVTETVFDKYIVKFREVLHHADTYVRATALQKPVFTFEIGVILPLFQVASKCRVPSTRRQALDLMLKSPKKESTFGAYSCAQVLRRLIVVEEEGLGLPPPDLSGCCSLQPIDDTVRPAEDKRVHSFDLLKNRKARTYEIRVTRYTTHGGCLERVVEDFPI